MPRNTPPTGKVSPLIERVIGSICFVLMIAIFTEGNLTHDNQIRIGCLIAGLLYFMTAIGLATDNGID
jgi:hypothetical protein